MQRLEDYVAGDSIALAPVIEVKEGGAKEAATDLRIAAQTKGHMIHGLSDFDHDAIATASKDAISVMHEGLDPGLHIPLGTLLRSAWRELELLFDKKIPIERAVKHVAMDVASVGTGAFVGAKVGGGIGAFAGLSGSHQLAAGAACDNGAGVIHGNVTRSGAFQPLGNSSSHGPLISKGSGREGTSTLKLPAGGGLQLVLSRLRHLDVVTCVA